MFILLISVCVLLLLFGYVFIKKILLEKENKIKIIPLGVGSVLIKNALNGEDQSWLSYFAMEMGETEKNGGFWRRNLQTLEKIGLNATHTRGRIYQALSDYPHANKIRELCLKLVCEARKVVPKIPLMTPTHLLLLYYVSEHGIRWHRDSDPNDGDNDEPIVSISLGNTCIFGYKPFARPSKTIEIKSGDVLVWGGPERMLAHRVESVKLGTTPKYLRKIIGNARLNFTFRSAPNILGLEKFYTSDKSYLDALF